MMVEQNNMKNKIDDNENTTNDDVVRDTNINKDFSLSEDNNDNQDNKECACCLSDVTKKLECSHYIHLKCICLSGKLECPICRHKFDENIFTAELLMVYDKKKMEIKEYNEEHEMDLIIDVVNHVDEEYNMSYLMEDLLSRLIYNYN